MIAGAREHVGYNMPAWAREAELTSEDLIPDLQAAVLYLAFHPVCAEDYGFAGLSVNLSGNN